MQLLWVRHGQMQMDADAETTLVEVNRMFNGELQSGLSDVGREQAERVARHLGAGEPIAAVYHSSMDRARETAAATAVGLGLEAIEHVGIEELRPGYIPQGSLLHGIIRLARRLPERAQRMVLGFSLIPGVLRSWASGNTEGGESYPQVEDRLWRFFERLRQEQPPDARVAIFAHGYLILLLSLAATDRFSRWRIWRKPYIANGSITEVELPQVGRPRLLRFADASHM